MLAICNIAVYEKDRAIWTSRIHPSNSRIAKNWKFNIICLISKKKIISGIEENYLNLIKGACKTLTANYTFCGKIFHPMYSLWPSILYYQELEYIFNPLQSVQVYNYNDQCSKVEVTHLTSKAKS